MRVGDEDIIPSSFITFVFLSLLQQHFTSRWNLFRLTVAGSRVAWWADVWWWVTGSWSTGPCSCRSGVSCAQSRLEPRCFAASYDCSREPRCTDPHKIGLWGILSSEEEQFWRMNTRSKVTGILPVHEANLRHRCMTRCTSCFHVSSSRATSANVRNFRFDFSLLSMDRTRWKRGSSGVVFMKYTSYITLGSYGKLFVIQ